MSNSLSMDLRVRFKRLMDGGMCAAAAGRTLLLSAATTSRWGKKVRDGAPMNPLPSGPRKGSGKLELYVPFFVELMAQDPDITLAELQAALDGPRGGLFHEWHRCSSASPRILI